jgi:hypothetical protein
LTSSLEPSDFIQVNEISGTPSKVHSLKSLMLSKKRLSGINLSGKQFSVELRIDLFEL